MNAPSRKLWTFASILCIVFCFTSVQADTVVLTDGKRHENVKARPLPGGLLEVTFSNGRKLVLKKEAVRSLYIGPVQPKKKIPAKSPSPSPRRAPEPAKKTEYLKDLAARTVTARAVAAETVAADTVAAGSITAENIAAKNISGTKIIADTITADTINARRIVTAGGRVLFRPPVPKPASAERPIVPKRKPPPDWSGWSLIFPGLRGGSRSHNYLLVSYVLLSGVIINDGRTGMARARIESDSYNFLAFTNFIGVPTFGVTALLQGFTWRRLALDAGNRGKSSASRVNLGAFLFVGAYLYNIWDVIGTNRRSSAAGNVERSAVHMDFYSENFGDLGRGKGDSAIRVKWSVRF